MPHRARLRESVQKHNGLAYAASAHKKLRTVGLIALSLKCVEHNPN